MNTAERMALSRLNQALQLVAEAQSDLSGVKHNLDSKFTKAEVAIRLIVHELLEDKS